MSTTPTLIDVRAVPPLDRHPLIFATFDALAVGAAFELVNNHDPVPLFYQFRKARPQQFHWQYLTAGPARWHVRIARVASGDAAAAGESDPGDAAPS